ncbi:MAG TPA: TaqI-like C-terminal specificity domain-containing protein [Desulfosporosinus sp.]|nr:TaqI-like C-terminal specificity domain-containing protein [Desulfosporosinus sp.]
MRQLDFSQPKIVAPQRSKSNTFGYNEVIWYASMDVYFITAKENSNVMLKYVLALLNSKLYYLWLYNRGKRKGESLELYQQPLSEIPIKEISKEQQLSIVELVDHILIVKKDDPTADITSIEMQIDQLIYEIYDLSKDEIKIIEGD